MRGTTAAWGEFLNGVEKSLPAVVESLKQLVSDCEGEFATTSFVVSVMIVLDALYSKMNNWTSLGPYVVPLTLKHPNCTFVNP